MKCPNCNEVELKGKQSYCSDRCRVAYARRTKAGEQTEQIEPEHATRTFDFKLTRTDRVWENSRPGYYNFSNKLYEKECFVCSGKFSTHLRLLKVCSMKCKRDYWDAFKPEASK